MLERKYMHLKHRSLVGITLLTIITLGLYQIYWYFITKTEMNILNGKYVKVPFFLCFFIPIVRIWWFWRFAKAIEKSTKGNVNRWSAFLAPIILEVLGGIVLAVAYPTFRVTDTNLVSNWFAVLIAVVVSLLPIYYFQSNLNEYSS